MRIGVMIGPERGDTARKVKRLIGDIEWAERAGISTAWIPQIPSDMDTLQMVSLLGTRTETIELGTAVVPLQAQHPVALARQALTAHAITGGRLTLGVGPSHHWIVTDMLGLPYDTFTVRNPNDVGAVAPLPVLVAALGPVMLTIAGERADGTVLRMADERAIGEHVAPGSSWARPRSPRTTSASSTTATPAPSGTSPGRRSRPRCSTPTCAAACPSNWMA